MPGLRLPDRALGLVSLVRPVWMDEPPGEVQPMSKLIEDRIGNWLAPDQWRVASTTSMAEAYSLLREAESELRRLRKFEPKPEPEPLGRGYYVCVRCGNRSDSPCTRHR